MKSLGLLSALGLITFLIGFVGFAVPAMDERDKAQEDLGSCDVSLALKRQDYSECLGRAARLSGRDLKGLPERSLACFAYVEVLARQSRIACFKTLERCGAKLRSRDVSPDYEVVIECVATE